MSYSVSSPFPTPEQPYRIQPVEMVPPPTVFNPDQAARLAAAEVGSLGLAYHQAFLEAEQRVAAGFADQGNEAFAREVYPSDPKAYREFLASFEHRQGESDAIKHLEREFRSDEPEISEFDLAAGFRAFDRSFARTIKEFSGKIHPRQINQLLYQGKSIFNFRARDLLTQRLLLVADHPEMFADENYERVLETEMDKAPLLFGDIEYLDTMDSKKALGLIRRSGTHRTEDQLHADVQALRRATYRTDYAELSQASELQDSSLN